MDVADWLTGEDPDVAALFDGAVVRLGENTLVTGVTAVCEITCVSDPGPPPVIAATLEPLNDPVPADCPMICAMGPKPVPVAELRASSVGATVTELENAAPASETLWPGARVMTGSAV